MNGRRLAIGLLLALVIVIGLVFWLALSNRGVPAPLGAVPAEPRPTAQIAAHPASMQGPELDLGTWQRVFYAELDGQRSKRLIVKVLGA